MPSPTKFIDAIADRLTTAEDRPSTRLTMMPTGVKMLLILTAALLPLGLIALFVSIDSARNNRLQHETDARALVAGAARQIDLVIDRNAAALTTLAADPPADREACRERLAALARGGDPGARYAFYSMRGQPRCADPSFRPGAVLPPREEVGVAALLIDRPPAIRVATGDGDGFAVGEIPLATLARQVLAGAGGHAAILSQGEVRLRLDDPRRAATLDQRITVSAPVAGGQMALEMTVNVNYVTAIEVLLVLLPMLMWVAAAVIGWAVVDRLLVRPLRQLERAITSFEPGHGPLTLPRLATPAREIATLGDAFRRATDALARHDAEMAEGLNRQTRLTREVHHRVKNNLQVVASLINLHARGAAPEASAAYAAIQRRVDALAVVHRNHFAEVEENRGVGLRSLLAELAANLRATAPEPARHFAITLDMMPAYVSQDVAVPVSFLVTEMAELAMACDPRGAVAVTLSSAAAADRALLVVEARGLAEEECRARPEHDRFDRIVTGLARQLRAPLTHDPGSGRYAIEIAVIATDAQDS